MAIVVGWREWVALPGLGITAINAKVDTGARSSALHVDTQWRFTEGGAPWVGFRLTPGGSAATLECASEIVDEREVTDSGGHVSLRAFVRTPLRVAGIVVERAVPAMFVESTITPRTVTAVITAGAGRNPPSVPI